MQSAKWVTIADYLSGMRARYADLQAIEVPSTLNAEPQIRAEMVELERAPCSNESRALTMI